MHRVVGGLQRSGGAAHVAGVSRADVREDLGLVHLFAATAQFERPAPGALLGRGRDVELHLGLGADHRADVAPVQHRAGSFARKAALELDQRLTHLRIG